MRKMSDESALLRIALEEIFASATEPMTSTEIAQKPSVVELGFDNGSLATLLRKLMNQKNPPFPIKRVAWGGGKGAGRGAPRFGYYNPKVVSLVPAPKVVKAPVEAAPVNTVNPQEFQFDPVAFDAPVGAAPVALPAEVKTITMTVGGVTIKIEIGGAS